MIGLLKNKYLILKGPLAISLLKHKGDQGVASIDKILTVYCALTKMSIYCLVTEYHQLVLPILILVTHAVLLLNFGLCIDMKDMTLVLLL